MKNRDEVILMQNGAVLPLPAIKNPVLLRVLDKRITACNGRDYGVGPKFNFSTHQEHDAYSQGTGYNDHYDDNGYSENDKRH